MATFTFDVLETRTYFCSYTVDAVDIAEAVQKAQIGDTTYDYTLHEEGVSNRHIIGVGHYDKNGEFKTNYKAEEELELNE